MRTHNGTHTRLLAAPNKHTRVHAYADTHINGAGVSVRVLILARVHVRANHVCVLDICACTSAPPRNYISDASVLFMAHELTQGNLCGCSPEEPDYDEDEEEDEEDEELQEGGVHMLPRGGRQAFRNRYEYAEPYDSDSMDDEYEDPDMEDDEEEDDDDDDDDDDSEDSEDESMEDGIPSHSKHSSVVIEELDNEDLEVISRACGQALLVKGNYGFRLFLPHVFLQVQSSVITLDTCMKLCIHFWPRIAGLFLLQGEYA